MSKGLEALKLCEERDGILIRTEINTIKKELQDYEDLKKQIEECSSKDALFIYNNEHKRRMDLQLKLEKAYKNIEVLKEGLKTLTKHYAIKLYPMQIKYISDYMVDIPQEDSVKIKAMLEVVENGK